MTTNVTTFLTHCDNSDFGNIETTQKIYIQAKNDISVDKYELYETDIYFKISKAFLLTFFTANII